LQFQR
jgi:hypothetical protein